MSHIAKQDPKIAAAIKAEQSRQQHHIELIASENFVSPAVMEAQGSVMTNKYAEGYPAKRYYNGCDFVDIAEDLAIERAKELFNVDYVNVQPHSGSQANQAAYLALIQPGDTILGMSLDSGGHLTHGATPNISGRWFHAVHYEVNETSFLIDYDEVERLAIEHKPQLIIAGYSAYSREIDFKRFREIADKVGAYLMADIAHIAGLVATGVHPSPAAYVDVITTTTHKTLRGPRGGMVMTNDADIAKKVNFALFPGLQGGPLMHVIAAKAVAFGEALQPEFREYTKQIVKNAQALAAELKSKGYEILTEGTDNHMLLIDLRKQDITGKDAALYLDKAGIICNKNAVPFDTASPFITSGIRLGTPACTTRGFKEAEFKQIAQLIHEVLSSIQEGGDTDEICNKIRIQVSDICKKFPLPY